MSNLKNYNYCKDALTLKKRIESDFLALAEYLHNIKEKELYRPSWSSWEEYREELKMSENSVNKLIQIHQKLIVSYKIPANDVASAGGWSVIADLLPVMTSKTDAEEWLKKSELLTRDDLRKEIQEAKTGMPMADCKHKDTYTVRICRCCRLRIEEHSQK